MRFTLNDYYIEIFRMARSKDFKISVAECKKSNKYTDA